MKWTHGLALGRSASVCEDEVMNLNGLVRRNGSEGVSRRHDSSGGVGRGGRGRSGLEAGWQWITKRAGVGTSRGRRERGPVESVTTKFKTERDSS